MTPVTRVIQLALLAVALLKISRIKPFGNGRSHKRNGIQAKDSHPDLVPSGGELPQSISLPGQ